jgi:hypothetical protein
LRVLPRFLLRLTVALVTFGAGLLAWGLWASNYGGGIYRRLPWSELTYAVLYALAAFWCLALASSGGKTKGQGDRLFRWLMLACGGLFLSAVCVTVLGEVVRTFSRVIRAHNGIVEYY